MKTYLKTYLTTFTKYTVMFIFLLCIFHGLLYLACSFPSEAIYENVVSSADRLMIEGNMYKIGLVEKVDNYSDSLVINEAYSIDYEKPFESYMFARKNYNKDVTQFVLPDTEGSLYSYCDNVIDSNGNPFPDAKYDTCKELQEFVKGNVLTSVNYSRYYHGFLVIFRVLLLFLDITGIRIFMAIIFLLILIYLAYLLKKKFNTQTMLIFVYSLLMYGYFYVSYSLQQSLLYLVMLISSILLLRKIEIYTLPKLHMHLFITGALANYFDFFTVPVLTLALPLLIYVLYYHETQFKKETFFKQLKNIVVCGIFWSLGYVFTWLSKWILLDLVYDCGGVLSAINQIRYRSYGDIAWVCSNLLDALNIFFTTFIIYIILFFIILLSNKNIQFKKFKFKNLKNEIALLLTACIPIAWCLISFNHAILHIMFSYRNMLIALIVTLLIILKHCEYFKTYKKTQKK